MPLTRLRGEDGMKYPFTENFYQRQTKRDTRLVITLDVLSYRRHVTLSSVINV